MSDTLNNRTKTRGWRWRRRLSATVSISLIVLTFSGCTSPAETASSELPPDYSTSTSVCELLTLKELEAILGRTFHPGTSKAVYDARINQRIEGGSPRGIVPAAFNIVGLTRCLYASKQRLGVVAPKTTVELGVASAFADRVWRTQTDQLARVAKPLHGVGDEALSTVSAVIVLSDGKILAVSSGMRALYEPPSDLRERAIRLARIAHRRLQEG